MITVQRLISASLLIPVLALAAACPGGEDQPPVADGTTSSGDGSSGASADETATDSGDAEACVENPVDSVELLNGCTDASCEPFANTPERLPLLQTDGSLPPLP